jgi:hypothetical protein
MSELPNCSKRTNVHRRTLRPKKPSMKLRSGDVFARRLELPRATKASRWDGMISAVASRYMGASSPRQEKSAVMPAGNWAETLSAKQVLVPS